MSLVHSARNGEKLYQNNPVFVAVLQHLRHYRVHYLLLALKYSEGKRSRVKIEGELVGCERWLPYE